MNCPVGETCARGICKCGDNPSCDGKKSYDCDSTLNEPQCTKGINSLETLKSLAYKYLHKTCL